MGAVESFRRAEALGFCGHPTSQRASVVIGAVLPRKPSTPEGQGRLDRGVKRYAVGKAGRFAQRGIDPGVTHLESGNPLREAGRVANSAQQLGCLGAYLIRRRLCGNSFSEMPILSDDLLLTPSPLPLPLEWGGWVGVNRPGIRKPVTVISPAVHIRRPHHG